MNDVTDDFRQAAVTESERVIARSGGSRGDPMASGVSYCLWRENRERGAALKRRLQARALLGTGALLILVVTGLGAGAWWLFASRYAWIAGAIAVGAFGVAWTLLQYTTTVEARLVEKFLREEMGELWADATNVPVALRIENEKTRNKLKIIAEDIGVMVLFPDAHCIELEGFGARYLVFGADVTRLELVRNTILEVIVLEYRIGNELLALSIRPDPTTTRSKANAGKPSNPVWDRICATFGTSVTPVNKVQVPQGRIA